jgi:hypothetical protein
VLIAKSHGCEVRTFSTNNQLDDVAYLNIKNNCWKGNNGWVIIADCDELLMATQTEYGFDENKINLVRGTGYNMVNMEDNLDVYHMKSAIRAESYDKVYAFYAPDFEEINYAPGAHTCEPKTKLWRMGEIGIKQNDFIARTFHFKYINVDYMIARHAEFAKRLSTNNLQNGYGGHYLYTPEQIREEFENARKNAVELW